MDPISAVGFASSIITFIEFAHKLVTGTLQVIDAGSTAQNVETKVVVDDLHSVTSALEAEISGLSDHEAALKGLSAKCKSVSLRLQALLEKQMAKSDSKWEAVRTALRAMRKEREVAELVGQLEQYRSEILTRLVLILNERQLSTTLQIASLGDQAGDQSSSLTKHLTDLQDNILKSFEANRAQDRSRLDKLKSLLGGLLSSSRPPTPETRVLRQLYFPSMFSREDNIAPAEADTFRWILRGALDDDELDDDELDDGELDDGELDDDGLHADAQDTDSLYVEGPSEQQRAARYFLSWLSEESNIFHISGKAGSGKSTLMKLIASHPRTREELEEWAGEKQLIFCQFFAWRAGDSMQQSLDGLYRSILFSILVQCPNLIPAVFPDAFKTFMRRPCEPYIDEPFFRYPELRCALKRLITDSPNPDIRFCFLIDGLDEFKNEPAQRHGYGDLVLELDAWAAHGNVKLLLSSRPEAQFASIVPDQRRIRLHELTAPDIRAAGRAMFEKHPSFRHTRLYYQSLVDHVVYNAQGVFLWAFLIILELRSLAAAGEDFASLEKRLNLSPGDLEALYEQFLRSIDPLHRDEVYRMILIVLSYSIAESYGPGCPVYAMTWLDQLFDPDFPITSPRELYSEEERIRRKELGERRVARTRGLLEINTAELTVDFFHRTAYDFVRRSPDLRDFAASIPRFNEKSLQVRARLADLWFLNGEWGNDAFYSGDNPRRASVRTVEYAVRSAKSSHPADERFRWLDALEALNNCNPSPSSSSEVPIPSIFCDASGRGSRIASRASHLHYVSSTVCDVEYLRRRLQGAPDAVHGDGHLSLIVSSIFSLHPSEIIYEKGWSSFENDIALVDYLLDKGASPNEEVRFWGQEHGASAWLIFCVRLATLIVKDYFRSTIPFYLDVLQRFLRTGKVDPDVSIVYGRYLDQKEKGSDLWTITLGDLVRRFDPERCDVWDRLFEEAHAGKRNAGWWATLVAIRDRCSRLLAGEARPGPLAPGGELESALSGFDEEQGNYLHSVVLGDTTVLANDVEIRVF